MESRNNKTTKETFLTLKGNDRLVGVSAMDAINDENNAAVRDAAMVSAMDAAMVSARDAINTDQVACCYFF